MQSKAQVASNGHAVLADHGNAGAAVYPSRLVVCALAGWKNVLMAKGEDMVLGNQMSMQMALREYFAARGCLLSNDSDKGGAQMKRKCL